jgi:hypothetical protein
VSCGTSGVAYGCRGTTGTSCFCGATVEGTASCFSNTGACGASCVSSTQCPAGWGCATNTCCGGCTYTGCTSSTQCPTGRFCAPGGYCCVSGGTCLQFCGAGAAPVRATTWGHRSPTDPRG